MSKFLVASAAAALFAAVANAQSAPDWKLIPAKCATDCANTVQTSFLCNEQYSIGTLVYGCFCKSFPSDADGCATCLESNNAAALANLLKGTKTDCPTQEKACNFQCAFNTCDAQNDPGSQCQCDAGYLANIYNCASCNTANNNEGTKLDDFKSLNASCGNQNFTGPAQAFATWLPSPTGSANYAAPTLTATGGGDAATGTFVAATDKAAPTANAGAPAATGASNSTGSTGAGAASGSSSAGAGASASASPSTSGSKTSPSGPAATTTPTGGAMGVTVPAGAAVAAALVAALL